MSGVYCYFGITSSGKTTLAMHHLIGDMKRDGQPALVLDCMPARNLRDYPHAKDPRAVVELLYGMPAEGELPARPRTSAFYTPRSEDELAKLLDAVHAAGARGAPVHVLWDEASLHQSPQHLDGRIAQALRGWQHNGCTFRIVTQRPADLHGVIFATMPEVYCFRLERQADLDRVRAELRLDPAVIEKLNQGQFETYPRDRFKTLKGAAHDSDPHRVGSSEDPGRHADPVHADRNVESPAPVPRPLSQDLGRGGAVPGGGPGPDAGGAPEKP